MIYLKLSARNARRSFTDYLLYVATMTVLLAVMEVSNCIAVMGELAGFQATSLPLLIAVIQVALVGYIDSFMLKQRAKEFASYLLLGMGKKRLAALFLCEILLIGLGCYLAGTTMGFALYRLCCPGGGFLYGRSMAHTFGYFCLMEAVCSLRLTRRLGKLQIRELMYEKNRNQSVKEGENDKRWGMVFILCFACLVGLVCGVACLPGDYIVYAISVVAIPLLAAVVAFYKWIFGSLYARRRIKPATVYQKDRLYIIANMTSGFRTAVTVNAIFCICLLFSACSFIAGRLMLQPEFQLFDRAAQQWMGASQISICLVFLAIYFSILSLQQIIELRQDARGKQVLHCLGKSGRQVERLVNRQIVIKLAFPMLMVLLVFLFCMPLLNGKMNLVLPAAMRNALFRLAGEFFACIAFFFICYFGIVSTMAKRYIKPPA